MTVYGYARVSGAGQDYERQVQRLAEAGSARIFSEKGSAAAGRKRPALRQLVALLAAGDVLVVTSMSRFGRSLRDALNVLHTVISSGAQFQSLDEPWADTTTPAGKMVSAVFLAFAEYDRADILRRTNDGRRAAQARGVRMGRRPRLDAAQQRFVRAQRAARPPVPINELARVLGVNRSTIVRACARPPAPILSAAGEQIDLEELTRMGDVVAHDVPQLVQP